MNLVKRKQLNLGLVLAKYSGERMTAREVYSKLISECSIPGFSHPRGVATYLMKYAKEVDESKYPNEYVL